MPKIIPLQDMREWLQNYEQGKSEAAIAKEAHRDLKAVKRGIEWARNERDAATARAGLLKDALSNHQEKLLGIIDRILSALILPPPDLPLVKEKDGPLIPTQLLGTTVSYHKDTGLVVTLWDEDTTYGELLREHLARDRMWALLDQWRKAMGAHIEAGVGLKLKVEMLLEIKTGCQLVSEPIDSPFMYSYTAVDIIYQATGRSALGFPSGINLEERLVADPDSQEVRYGPGTIFAENVNDAEKCRANILDAFESLQIVSEIKKLQETYENLKASTYKARRATEEISLLRLVPGRCRVCRRLGI